MLFRRLIGVTLLSCAATAAGAQTTTMDFSTLQPYNNYDPLPQSFGDHANLNVTNRTRTGFGNSSELCSYVDLWGPGYSALTAAAFACGNGNVGELFFQPTAGRTVTLNNLFLGSYPSTNGIGPAQAMTVKVFDTGWNEIFNFAGNVSSSLQIAPGVSSSQGLYLQWGTNWNTGVNLVNTTVASVTVPPVVTPEPASIALVAAGLGLIAFVKRRE